MSTTLDRFAPRSPDEQATLFMTVAETRDYYAGLRREETRRRIEELRDERQEVEGQIVKLNAKFDRIEAEIADLHAKLKENHP